MGRPGLGQQAQQNLGLLEYYCISFVVCVCVF